MRTKILDAVRKAEDFLKNAALYRLGDLPTEGFHPDTRDLSRLAVEDIETAIATLKRIDLSAIGKIEGKIGELESLRENIRGTLTAGGRIFLCGCGATGRLALTLENLWREKYHAGKWEKTVVSFMAGGDIALVRAVEGFEDYPEYGARQLEDLGFGRADLLVSFTEGGETPFVIGATERGAELADSPPYFLYCNPDDVLSRLVERSRRVIENPRIRKLNLTVGPMALSGSTRMQATTVLMLATGIALLYLDDKRPVGELWEGLNRTAERLDYGFLADFIMKESSVYKNGGALIYETGLYGITVFTDTTERAPTFSLVPFENENDRGARPSSCYLRLPRTSGVLEAWHSLLNRNPRTVEWRLTRPITGMKTLKGFDFSKDALAKRERRLPGVKSHGFWIGGKEGAFLFDFDGLAHRTATAGEDLFSQHLLLKLLLNTLSTLVMGRLGRYTGNVMTWVKPNNGKLVDRAVRYVRRLLNENGRGDFAYDDVVRALFREMETAGPSDSVVIKTSETLGGLKAAFPSSRLLLLLFFFAAVAIAAPAKARRYELVPGKSKAEFTSEATLESVSGATTEVSGWLDFSPASLATARADVTVDLTALSTDNRLRDKHMREDFLETIRYPKATFTLKSVTPAKLAKGESGVTVSGEFSVHGVSRAITAPSRIRWSDGNDEITVDATFSIKLKDYGIRRPEFLFLKLAEEVTVKIRIRGKP